MKPRLLDLFCGAGGAGMGYHRAGFDVIGVDIKPQPHYPFEFHQADALTFPLDGFDAIHASPPCQAFTAYRRRPGHVGDYPDLIEPTRQKVRRTGQPYVIENVEGAPMRETVTYCGTAFGRPVRRHRLFESNVALLVPPCQHRAFPPVFPGATNRKTNSRRTVQVGAWNIPVQQQRAAMGIDWMALEELSEAIPPDYTEHIGRQLMAAIEASAAA